MSLWLHRNVGGDSLKYLKMQKLLLVQTLSLERVNKKHNIDGIEKDDNLMALNFRLIQLVELGAKTAEYRKSKQGGKLAMKNVAQELGFPTFLVQLRHQAVHERGLLSLEVIQLAVRRL